MRRLTNNPPFYSQHGFTLLEALVGFLILSIGLLGIASLHTLSLQSGKSAIYKTVAVEKAQQIIESIRANAAELEPETGTSAYIAGYSDSGVICATSCNSQQQALDDIYHWKKDLKTGLPNRASTKAKVEVGAAVAGSHLHTVTVTVKWRERSNTSRTGVAKSYVLTTDICSQEPC